MEELVDVLAPQIHEQNVRLRLDVDQPSCDLHEVPVHVRGRPWFLVSLRVLVHVFHHAISLIQGFLSACNTRSRPRYLIYLLQYSDMFSQSNTEKSEVEGCKWAKLSVVNLP